jgi:glycosyltransferase involved in cell wall biosynthesis
MSKIEIIIATFNRPNLILRAIDSVLKQTFKDFELIISDNSTNNETKNVISKNNYYNLIYKKRDKFLTGIEHLNIILNEINSEYFIIFHDDDVMHPQMISRLFSTLEKYNEILAVGCNSIINIKNRNQDKLFSNLKNDKIIERQHQLVEAYSINKSFVPFPSYLYKREVAKNLRLNINNGGKFCDLAFLCEILNFGKIYFIAKPLMTYYIHKNQDTAKHEFLDKIKLINYLKNSLIENKNAINILRSENIYAELKFVVYNKINYIIHPKRFIKQSSIIYKYLGLKMLSKMFFLYLLYIKNYYTNECFIRRFKI